MSDKSERIPRFAKLERPEFKSTIPAHLLNQMNATEQYVVASLSRMEAVFEWLISSALAGNKADIETDLRLQVVEDWKAIVSSKWAVITVFILLLLPIVLEKVLNHPAQ
jgi:hypothetical protein